MIKQITLLVASITILTVGYILLIVFGNGNQAHSNGNGAPVAHTGSPADGQTCTACHSGAALTPQTGWITSNVPINGYIPNTTYTITATATRAGHTKFGFEVSPQNIAGNLKGTLINTSTQTQLIGSGKYITHTSSGTSGSSGFKTWSFNWTSPAQGTGSVTFYGAFNITNANNNALGDSISTSTLVIPEDLGVGISENDLYSNIEISPNPARTFFKVNSSKNNIIKNVQLFNMNGQMVLDELWTTDAINIENLNKGLYVVKINSNDKPILKKLIIN
jgi:hypothetical protein